MTWIADHQVRAIPLNTGGLIDPEHVVGREEDLRRIFVAFGSVGVVLTGDRRLGKTSLARLVALRAWQLGWDVITQSAQGYTTLADFRTALVTRLDDAQGPARKSARALRYRCTLKAPGLEVAPAAAAPRLLEDAVAAAVRASSERLLLIIDELPVLARELEHVQPGSGIAMLHMLRRLRQEHPDRLRMLCLGSIGFHHALRGEGQGALNDLEPQRLGPLTHPKATYLAACIFRDAGAPRAFEQDVAPVVALASEGAPYFVHEIVADVLRRHARCCSAADVERIVDSALADPDDRWHLRHYVDRVESYYREDAPLARAVLDAIASEPSGLTFAELVRQLAAHRALATIDDERVREVVRRLDADHYLSRDSDRRRFALSLIRRAWIVHRT